MIEKWGQNQGKWDLVKVSWGVRVIQVQVTRALLYQHLFCTCKMKLDITSHVSTSLLSFLVIFIIAGFFTPSSII